MLKAMLAAALLVAAAAAPSAAKDRPFRGAVKIAVLLCKYSDAPTPAKNRAFYEELFIKSDTGGVADYWRDVSYGSVTLDGSTVRGWFTLDQTEAQARAYGGGGSPDRGKKHSDCVAKANQMGQGPAPDADVVVVVTSPGIDAFGGGGRAFMGEDATTGLIAHEVGHGLSLNHSYSDDDAHCNATWATRGEYDDQWDMMSYGDVWAANHPQFGLGAPWLNAYHLDRMGWLRRDKVLRFGADGDYDRVVTLSAPSRPGAAGYSLVRIPFDPNDLKRYYTVEYRVDESWDAAIPGDAIMIHEIDDRTRFRCSDGDDRGRAYRSYLVRAGGPDRTPEESIDMNGVRVDLVSKDPAAGTARVRIRSERPDRCVRGLVWRAARPADHVCVSPSRRNAVRHENQSAALHRQPGGGAYGPDTCKQGMVWREAFPGDRVCVSPQSRATARAENRGAFERRIGGAAYGPNACASGHVWREADIRDWVCVPAQRRDEVREENRLAASRRQPGGGAYGPDTCRQGFVWRDAFPGDRVCVSRAARSAAAADNAAANGRLADKGA